MKDRTSGKSETMNWKRETTIIKLAVARPARGYNAYCLQGSRSCHRSQGTVHDGHLDQRRRNKTDWGLNITPDVRATSNKTVYLNS